MAKVGKVIILYLVAPVITLISPASVATENATSDAPGSAGRGGRKYKLPGKVEREGKLRISS